MVDGKPIRLFFQDATLCYSFNCFIHENGVIDGEVKLTPLKVIVPIKFVLPRSSRDDILNIFRTFGSGDPSWRYRARIDGSFLGIIDGTKGAVELDKLTSPLRRLIELQIDTLRSKH